MPKRSFAATRAAAVSPCDICCESASGQHDPLLKCSKCGVSVHARCYGVVGTPASPWGCRSCTSRKRGDRTCAFCGQSGGALKPCDDAPPGSSQFAHIHCAVWLPPADFGAGYLGHFALVHKLLPRLRATDGARVVTLSSVMHWFGQLSNWDYPLTGQYPISELLAGSGSSYCDAKLALTFLAVSLRQRGVHSTAVNPGAVWSDIWWRGLLTPAPPGAARRQRSHQPTAWTPCCLVLAPHPLWSLLRDVLGSPRD